MTNPSHSKDADSVDEKLSPDLLMCIGLLTECVQIEVDHRPAEYTPRHAALVHSLDECCRVFEAVARGHAPLIDSSVSFGGVLEVLDASRGAEPVRTRVETVRSMLEALASRVQEGTQEKLH